jgi:sugar/nucleoside kinase (ribokinase family)
MDMAGASLDVVGIGNAIVDVLAKADEAFLAAQGVPKGTMTLIDAARAEALYAAMPPAMEMSGGSAANTIAGIASLGGKAGFIGRVKDDELGQVFAHDIRALGVRYETALAKDGPPTARCLILVTPDAHRSMSTFLGACQTLTPEDVDPDLIRAAKIVYLEGYLWDPPDAKHAFRKAMDIAKGSKSKVAFSLSDPFCVARYRSEFRTLIDEARIDILFANEHELMSLYETDNFDDALQALRGRIGTAALTRSEKGSVVLWDGEVHVIDAEPDVSVVDTTGAGDLYAAGFLYGYAGGRDPQSCGRLGSLCASEAISHMGPRPETSLAKLASKKGLIAS